MVIEISIWTALGYGIASIPAVLGFLKIVQMVTDKGTTETPTTKTLKDNLEKANNDIIVLSKDITEIQLRLAEAKTDVEIKNLQVQMTDFKNALTRLQDKVERVTELTIKVMSKD